MRMNPGRYRELNERFLQADTTLTVDELNTVYYGSSFTPDYEPTQTYPRIENSLDEQDYEMAGMLADMALESNPTSLALYIMGLEAAEKGADNAENHIRLAKLGFKVDMLASTILLSGRGTNAQDPFFVISTSDMMRIVRNVFGATRIVDRAKVGDIDAVKITLPGSEREHIIYFDNTREANYLKTHPQPCN